MDQFGCPHSKDPKSSRAGTGGPPDGTFKNLKTGETEKRFNGGNIEDENISKVCGESTCFLAQSPVHVSQDGCTGARLRLWPARLPAFCVPAHMSAHHRPVWNPSRALLTCLRMQDTNAPGTLSMANTGRPNSGGSQFFLNVNNNANLDWFSGGQSKHPVFGKVTEGYDVAVAISKVKTVRDNPVKPIKMNSITVSGLPSDEL